MQEPNPFARGSEDMLKPGKRQTVEETSAERLKRVQTELITLKERSERGEDVMRQIEDKIVEERALLRGRAA